MHNIWWLGINLQNFPQTIGFFGLSFELPSRRTFYQYFHMPIITLTLNWLNLMQNNDIISNLPAINITIDDLEFAVAVLRENEFGAWVVNFEFDGGLLDGHVLSCNEIYESFFDFRGDAGVFAVVVDSVGFFCDFNDLWNGFWAFGVFWRRLWRWGGKFRWGWVLFLLWQVIVKVLLFKVVFFIQTNSIWWFYS